MSVGAIDQTAPALVEETDPDLELDRDRPMALEDHLEELRGRLLTSLTVWAAATAVSYYYTQPMLEVIRDLAGKDFVFIYTAPTEAFFAYLKLSMVSGLFLTMPVLIYQAVAFILPGLTRRERKWMMRMVPFAMLLFAGGAAFAWFVALPVTWKFFLSFQGPGVKAMWTIGEAVGFVVGLMVLTGLVFELPLVLLAAGMVGLVHSSTLRQHRKIAVFVAFVLAAVATPTPDAFTASVVALPIVLLFEVSLVLMRLVGR